MATTTGAAVVSPPGTPPVTIPVAARATRPLALGRDRPHLLARHNGGERNDRLDFPSGAFTRGVRGARRGGFRAAPRPLPPSLRGRGGAGGGFPGRRDPARDGLRQPLRPSRTFPRPSGWLRAGPCSERDSSPTWS